MKLGWKGAYNVAWITDMIDNNLEGFNGGVGWNPWRNERAITVNKEQLCETHIEKRVDDDGMDNTLHVIF